MSSVLESFEIAFGYDPQKRKNYNKSLNITFDDGTTAVKGVSINDIPKGICWQSDILSSKEYKSLSFELTEYIRMLQMQITMNNIENEQLKHKVEKLQEIIDSNIGNIELGS